ncbi:MAG: ABC transporter permease subunit [Planctomyces sp.]|jgi:sodium transport system permease protein|nr:sodium extrusion protein NatB [Planctomycetia bacterium]
MSTPGGRTFDTAAPTFRRLVRLARKECRESLRDRRTLATLLLMPLIVYPLLGMVVQRFAISGVSTAAPEANVVIDNRLSLDDARVMLAGLDDAEKTTEPATAAGEQSSGTSAMPAVPGLELPLLNPGSGRVRPQLRVDLGATYPVELIERGLREGVVDVGVVLRARAVDAPQDRTNTVEVLYRVGDPISEAAAEDVAFRLRENRDAAIRGLLNRVQIGGDALVMVRQKGLQTARRSESPLAAFVPLMLVLMTMTGAVYPAIDLTAGERERGTLELLMAAPVSRRQLLTGKFCAVFLVAVLTAVINLTAMMVTLAATGFDRVLLPQGIGVQMLLQVLLLLVVFASFFSSVLLSITSFARSFREAQAWLIPLMLVSLAPGILSLMPGIRLTAALSLVPLVNIVLLGRELFQGIAPTGLFLLTLLATAGYSAAALRLAAGIFGSDAVLFAADRREQQRSASQLLDFVPQRILLGTLLALLPLFAVLAGLRGRLVAPENTSGQLLLSAAVLAGVFVLLPLVAMRLGRVRLTAGFQLTGFHPVAIPAAVLLGCSAWVAVYELLVLAGSSGALQKIMDNPALRQMVDRLTSNTSLPLQLLCLAAAPAICEELFFRGFLWKGLENLLPGKIRPLLISTAVFAAAHVVTDASLTVERLPGTFLLGLLLGLMRMQTGSVIPGMLLHFCNNGVLLSLERLAPVMRTLGIALDVSHQQHLPGRLLLLAALLGVLGLALSAVVAARRRRSSLN